ncbi:MAG TPA: LLM class flavin-dependent oxidoreductase [Acidimicrobiales bacterium]|nr:LLM class flavin-dependent oxidoreductase [Acidimicrobiales bacterium]
MKVGLTLPQFRHESASAMETAALVEASGLDGVFAFDHLWPLGRPDRPALHGLTLAGALLAATSRIAVGTLVARVGLLPDAVLANQLATLARMGGGRLIAGLGVGDRMSRPENLAAGAPFRPREERLASLVAVCRRLRARGVTTWVGGNGAAIRSIARAEADAVNLWGVAPEEVAALAAVDGGGASLTWAGQVDMAAMDTSAVAGLLHQLDASGVAWAIAAPVQAAWPDAVERVAAAASSLVD